MHERRLQRAELLASETALPGSIGFDARERRHELLEELQLFCSQVERKRRRSRNVATGVRQADDEPAADSVTDNRHDDRDRASCVLAALVARPPSVTMTSTPLRTNSAARLGNCAPFPWE